MGHHGLGATGEFPEGRLNENDEGGLRFVIGHQNGKIILDFGKPVAWIGFSPQDAEQLIAFIKLHIEELKLENAKEGK